MLGIFLSKNQKLVKKWEKEHEDIVVLATNIIGNYSKNKLKEAKKDLKKLNDLAVNHVLNEDIEFYKLLKDQKRITSKNKEAINDFTKSFKNTKMDLMLFLNQYSKNEIELDDVFFKDFNDLVEVLSERISFEEENLYTLLYTEKR